MRATGGPATGGERKAARPGRTSPPDLPGSADDGPWPAADPIELTVLLRRGGGAFPDVLALGETPIPRRAYLSREEFTRRFGASADDLARVREFAAAHGLELRGADRARRAVTLRGASGELAALLGVRLRRRAHPTTPYRAQVGEPTLPPELREAVVGVLGLESRPLLRPQFRRNDDPTAVGYPVPTVGAAYGLSVVGAGSGATIGLLEFGGGFAAPDLASFFGGLGLPVPSPVVVGVDGATNAPTGDPNGPDAEVELDVELAGALAPGAGLAVYFAPNTEQGFADALTTAVHDATHRPSVVSISWGGPEASWTAAGRQALESAAQDAAVQGVTVLAAAGDQGASDGEAAGTLAVDFPASSPYVLGCGGTRLTLSGTSIVAEVVWNDLAGGEGATGGGVSQEFPLPSYQSGVGVPAAPNGSTGRGVPDVAADADPRTGYAVFVDGSAAEIGGTSAAAPLWAALLARLGNALGSPVGYANPLLYAPSARPGFRPITSGSNGGYSAGPGWNPCAGLGSPIAAELLAALRGER